MGSYDGWVSPNRRVKTCEAGVCATCGAKLSIYRTSGELTCAPCAAATAAFSAGATRRASQARV